MRRIVKIATPFVYASTRVWAAAPLATMQASPSALSPNLYMCQMRQSSSYREIEETTHSEEGKTDHAEDSLSTELGDDEFDYIEASCQEMHDIVLAMSNHLLTLGRPSRPHDTTRVPRKVPSHKKYVWVEDAVAGQEKFSEDFVRLKQHLTQESWNRLMESASKYDNNMRHAQLNTKFFPNSVAPKALWVGSDFAKYFKHAPYEAAQLRSDIPSHVVENARCLRDADTMRQLRRLTMANHEHRQALEVLLYTLVENAPKVDASRLNRTEGLGKPFGE
eukprot:GILI01017218.1.p1 GENE.GILI01017218.1~~GILI01017218.1.p1  ORF type:complete len:277 (-),score=37.60 GILI01017218.1:83-913(-)